MKVLKWIAFIVASLALGEIITRYVANLSVDTPHINHAIQWGIGLFNRTAATNPDVVFDVGTIILAILSTLLSGIVIYMLCLTFRSVRRNKAVRG